MGNTVLHAVELIISTILALFLAVLGTLARLIHEQAHGTPLTWARVLYALPAAIIMGVIGHAIGEYLYFTYKFPEVTGGAVGGVLGYLGPTVINESFRVLRERFGGKAKDGDD